MDRKSGKEDSGNLGNGKVKTIIFDLDGTLIDTEPSAAEAVRECFSDWKIEIDPSDATYVTGRTWESAFSYLFKKYSIPVPEAAAKDRMIKLYREALEKNLCIVAGSVQAVQSLATRFPLGLVSGSGRSEILWALKKLEIIQHFKVILGAEDYPRSKPSPDGYLKAVEVLRATPESCLVFEDSTAGIASAISAGLRVVAVTSTNHFAQDVSRAHLHIPDLTQVTANWVENLSFD